MTLRVLVTGADGLLGRHARALLHARNCAATFRGDSPPFDIVTADRRTFADTAALAQAMNGVEAVLHFAGVNRGTEAEVAQSNPAIASELCAAAEAAGSTAAKVIYANSVHVHTDSTYGKSKSAAARHLAATFPRFADVLIPHVFGEGARPDYNNVTATIIDRLLSGRDCQINPEGQVELVHAGRVAEFFVELLETGTVGQHRIAGHAMSTPELYAVLASMHQSYSAQIVPRIEAPLMSQLFNTYRYAAFPDLAERLLKLNSDARGTLFEAVRAENMGQTFMSTTQPGVTRGDHFHLRKVERFLVVKGKATIRIRNVLGKDVHKFEVDGSKPSFIDMPTMHTHSIRNTGNDDLYTLFWTNEFFNPFDPDTYSDKV
jgi:UDP-2-acetamido-2,6-beta-L-arabino-hexul-4-ose reductase